MKTIQNSELIERFIQLNEAVQALTQQLLQLDTENKPWGGWTLPVNDLLWQNQLSESAIGHPHQEAAAIYSSLSYSHNGDGRDTWQMAGLLVVPDEIITMAQDVNKAKERFAKGLKLLQQQQRLTSTALSQLILNGHYLKHPVRKLLAQPETARLHLRHCTRQIVIISKRPEAISLSWVKARRSIKTLTLKACEAALRKLDPTGVDGGVQAQLSTLFQLNSAEQKRLRQVQTVERPSIKGKLYWSDDSSQDLGYLSMPALLPANGLNCSLPEHTRLSQKPPETQRRKRRDSKLPDTPLLPSIRVYLTNP